MTILITTIVTSIITSTIWLAVILHDKWKYIDKIYGQNYTIQRLLIKYNLAVGYIPRDKRLQFINDVKDVLGSVNLSKDSEDLNIKTYTT